MYVIIFTIVTFKNSWYRKKGNKCIVLVTCKDGRNDGQTVFIGYLDEILEY